MICSGMVMWLRALGFTCKLTITGMTTELWIYDNMVGDLHSQEQRETITIIHDFLLNIDLFLSSTQVN